MRQPAVFLFAAAVATAASLAPGQTPAGGSPSTGAAPRLPITGDCPEECRGFERRLRGFLTQHGAPGASLAVARGKQLVVALGAGMADEDSGDPVLPDSLFRVASISKPITAAAVLALMESGRLRRDERVLDRLGIRPHLAPGATMDPRVRDITVDQLLRHTAGFDRETSGDPMFATTEIARDLGIAAPAAPPDIARWVLARPLDFAPGERFAYSNFGYSLLGQLVEEASGERYASFVRRRVLEPLGIGAMRLGRSLAADRAPGEVRYHDGARRVVPAVTGALGSPVPAPYGGFSMEALDAHGGWIGSAVDVTRFALAFADPSACPILGTESVRAMLARPPAAPTAGPAAGPDARGAYYACGWMVRPVGSAGNLTYWHTGSLPGAIGIVVRRHDGVTWTCLVNWRAARGQEDVLLELDRLLHHAADEVKLWPDVDLFLKYPSHRRARV